MAASITEPEFIWHDGTLLRWNEAKVHILTAAVQFGASVFEGIRCYCTPGGPAIFRLQDHLRRLAQSCRIYRMPLAHSLADLERGCTDLVRANGLDACYLRPMVLRGYGDMGMAAQGNPIETYIASWEWGRYLSGSDDGVDVCVSSWSRPAPNSFPAMAKAAGHYNNAALIKMEALANGFSEAIALSPDGMVSEGSGQNIFACVDGMLLTPPVDGSILSGITRASVIALAADLGLTVQERRLPRELLYTADELFFTGTATEIMPIRSVDHIPVADGQPGPLTRQLRERFMGIVTGEAEDRHGWLTPVQQTA